VQAAEGDIESNPAPCVSLRELDLAGSRVEDLQSLQKLVALETLNVKCIPADDWSIVQQCPRLPHLTAGVDDDGLFSADEVQELVDSVAHCLVKWSGLRPLEGQNPRRAMEEELPSFLRCAVLQEVVILATGKGFGFGLCAVAASVFWCACYDRRYEPDHEFAGEAVDEWKVPLPRNGTSSIVITRNEPTAASPTER
jgi:hypothetical protein